MSARKNQSGGGLDKVVDQALADSRQRAKGYRDRALGMFPARLRPFAAGNFPARS